MTPIKSKTIITKSKLPEVDFCFNPYIGCSHRCVYCYARFMGRFTGHSNEKWGSYIDWKENAPELLKKQAPFIKKQGGTVIIGSVTDCYQPIEKKLQLTRQCLEIFLNYQIPISILTKSSLVERDFDLLKRFQSCEVGFSLSLANEGHRKVIEPGASSIVERVETLQHAYLNGLKTYVFLGPIHPFLTDTEAIFSKIIPFVHFIMGETPNLQCGNWNDLSLALQKLKILPQEYRKIATSEDFYNQQLHLIQTICQNHSIECRGVFRH